MAPIFSTDIMRGDVPPTVTLDDVKQQMARMLLLQGEASLLTPWLERVQEPYGMLGRTDTTVGSMNQLLVLAIEGKRLDVLSTLLKAEWLDPKRAMRAFSTHDDRYPSVLFDGTLLSEMISPDQPSLRLASYHKDMAKTLDPKDPLKKVSKSTQKLSETYGTWNWRWSRPIEGYRYQRDFNVVGLAVMAGWAEGVSSLLEHGFDPYATNVRDARFTSPVMLATVYNEEACLKTLIEHPTFDVKRRYGWTDAAWERESPTDTNRLFWQFWDNKGGHGGLELQMILNHPLFGHLDKVRAALSNSLRDLPKRSMTHLSKGLDNLNENGLQSWEALVLQQTFTMGDPSVQVPMATSPPRRRL